MSVKDYIEARITYEPNSGCWIWLNQLDKDGYGSGFDKRVYKKKRAHRLAYEEWKGPIEDGLHIDHLCRVRCCVNPDHLEAVTCKENIRRGNTGGKVLERCQRGHDMSLSRKIRPNGQTFCEICAKENAASKYVKRERDPACNASKLDRDMVIRIRNEYDAGSSDSQIADRYGITRKHAWAVATRKSWGHIK